ncbi:alpha/beta fold hydrolase [Salinibius halmophilus]|uniref:alpha/beta fold hydrolase n=1 Tax=Salinibius halmophilus TaxID=1853216 RepID=UPI000E675E38|nr:alpha/beta hydrolase [Salinibius halmophilus]
MKRFIKWLTFGALGLLVMAATLPLFIKPTPLPNLVDSITLATSTSNFVQILNKDGGSTELHYQAFGNATGNKPTFVLIHGSTLNASSWSGITEDLSALGRVIAYDQVPYGLSSKTLPEGVQEADYYSLPAAASRLDALMKALALDNVILVGNSFGAVIATELLARKPDYVSGAVFIAPAVTVSGNSPTWLMQLPQMDGLGVLLARQLGASESFYRSMFADESAISSDMLAGARLNTAVSNWDTALWQYLRNWRYNQNELMQTLATTDYPVLVVAGTQDAIVKVEQSAFVAEQIPNSTFIEIAQCGHLPQIECPEPLFDAINQWVSTNHYLMP